MSEDPLDIMSRFIEYGMEANFSSKNEVIEFADEATSSLISRIPHLWFERDRNKIYVITDNAGEASRTIMDIIISFNTISVKLFADDSSVFDVMMQVMKVYTEYRAESGPSDSKSNNRYINNIKSSKSFYSENRKYLV